MANLLMYPFSRVVHYFFDLEAFPRVQGHISYAVDRHNALNNTFSNDPNPISNCTYGDLLNRRMFGLPRKRSSDPPVSKEPRIRNASLGYLYAIEDKKYLHDKVLYSLKVVLRLLRKGASPFSLQKFGSILRKDEDLESLLDETVALEEKIEVVEQRIELL
jgi:hypothetical protein